jgi:hypothetical protein
MQMLGPRDQWMGKRHDFRGYSVTIPDNPRWWALSVDYKSQTVFLAAPDTKVVTLQKVVTEKGDTGMAIMQMSGGPRHPGVHDLYAATIDLIVGPMPPAANTTSDAELIAMYFQDDLAFNVKSGYMTAESEGRGGRKKIGSRDYELMLIKLDKLANSDLLVACAIVRMENTSYLIVGKLWSKQLLDSDVDYLHDLLKSVKLRQDRPKEK